MLLATSAASAQQRGAPYFFGPPGSFDPYDGWHREVAPRPDTQPDKQAVRKRPKTKHAPMQVNRQDIPPGPVAIVVSIAKQRATVFMSGIRVADAPISTGVPDHPTPMGVFSVIAKSRYHSSNIYSGAPMPYMQRITWSGIALHQGPLPGYPASHGCIRLPEAFALKLWALTKVGARVIVTRDEIAPFAIEHLRLPVPKKPSETPAVVAQTPVLIASEATGTIAMSANSAGAAEVPAIEKPAIDKPKRKGPVQVFVSRKDSKVYVRQDLAPLFDAPVTVAEPDKPWGTHVFTVMTVKDEKASWTALTIPSGYPARIHRKLSARETERQQKRVFDLANAPTAAQALERFELPQEAADRIAQLLAPGSALIVSDNELSDETGLETDFIVLTQ